MSICSYWPAIHVPATVEKQKQEPGCLLSSYSFAFSYNFTPSESDDEDFRKKMKMGTKGLITDRDIFTSDNN